MGKMLVTFLWRLVYCYGEGEGNAEKVRDFPKYKEAFAGWTAEECEEVSESIIQYETETVSAIFVARIDALGEVVEQYKLA